MQHFLLAALLSLAASANAATSVVDGKVSASVGASSATVVAETNARIAADALRVLKGGDTMTGTLTLTGSTGSVVAAGSVTASGFFGNGAGLTGVSGSESNTFTSSKTFVSTVTVGGSLGIGTSNPVASLHGVVGDTSYRIGGSSLVFRGNGQGAFIGTRFNGTELSSSAVTHNQGLAMWGGSGFDGVRISTGQSVPAYIQVIATGPYTTTSHGTRMVFTTTPLGSTVLNFVMRLEDSGNVGIGTPLAQPASTKLDVNGDAQFGSGVNKSTFSATGALTINPAASITASSINVTNQLFVTDSNLSVGTQFKVTGNRLGLGTQTPQTLLDVNGESQFGTTVKSTFTTAGALTMAAEAAITLSGSGGYISSGSSVTASGLFAPALTVGTVTISGVAPPNGQALCLTGGRLGYCTTIVDATGGCICAAP